MATIAVYSVKGGVGKTTIAANLAWCAATISKRATLLWDLDASGGASFLLDVDPPPRQRAAGLFAHEQEPAALARATAWPGLALLPADASLRALDAALLKIGKKRRLARLIERLDSDYPRIVLDCPPVLNEVSAQVMRAADAVVVPLTPSLLSLRALEQIRADLADNHKRHPPLLPVLSMIDRRRASHRAAILAHPGWPVIPMASAIEQMATRRAPIGAFAPASPAAQAFAALWAIVERRLTRAA
ncbi:ParA family protein [Novosphingobium sp. Gsoil 351]|uniref:ParA family protein n=1 Tax=Novosphingobium sp. Gsoil 351 TaxID=2675225 RepID=UPI0012B484AE|nr:ParA family protein [Novosphingobium sp. Gsoil 351]QGN54537.1 AAA family ATPase [Novosphingobium sp. Gsoil 351]